MSRKIKFHRLIPSCYKPSWIPTGWCYNREYSKRLLNDKNRVSPERVIIFYNKQTNISIHQTQCVNMSFLYIWTPIYYLLFFQQFLPDNQCSQTVYVYQNTDSYYLLGRLYAKIRYYVHILDLYHKIQAM